MTRYISLAVTAVLVSGCHLYAGRCTYELRATDGAGTATINSSEAASAQVTLSEQRGSIAGQSFSWLVTGSLKGHVTSASFKDSSNPSTVLLTLPVLGPTRDPILEGAADTRDGAALAGFHDILVNGRGVIELQTDLVDTPVVTIPIATTNAGDWIRPYCS
ncbi:MAG TPA: hypothetical protein VJ840_04635 [Gemmatimonadaceae bacterium]|nr:hypothetical protein [Gemmatimonadaceae bacterium]